MKLKLLSTLLVSGALLVAGQAFASDAPTSRMTMNSGIFAAATPTKAKKHKKAKAAAPAATAKGSQANITGAGTVTGPISLSADAPAAPAAK